VLVRSFNAFDTVKQVELCCNWDDKSAGAVHRDVTKMLAYLHSFDIMVGPHGAGLANALYMPPCGVVAQLKGTRVL